MTPGEVLRDVRGYAQANRIVLTVHARQRMRERRATFADVQHALSAAERCEPAEEPERWRVTSADLDGDALTLVVAVEDGVVVVTLHE